jgi:hypothetical protein
VCSGKKKIGFKSDFGKSRSLELSKQYLSAGFYALVDATGHILMYPSSAALMEMVGQQEQSERRLS